MPKSIFQDMVKINNTRRLPKQLVEKRVDKKSTTDRPEQIERVREFPPREMREVGTSKNRHALWTVAFVAIIFFLFSISYFFARASVVVDPKIKDFHLDLNLSADLDGDAESLSFNLVTISGEVSQAVSATEEKEVAESARGTIILYNNFSSLPQKLDINTRLEGSNGKMYKTEKALIIPGMKGSTPGSIEVVVYGADAGEAYNSGPLDFKVFGFKGTPKYEKFYGRSKGDLKGGFKGLSQVVSMTEKTKFVAELKNSLRDKLLQKATDQIPTGFVLLKDAISLDVEDDADIEVLLMAKSIVLKGTLHGVLFEEEKLNKKIAEKVIDKYDGSDVYISNIKDLLFKISDTGTPLKEAKKIDFNLSGKATMVWKLDSEKLRADLLGKAKKDFSQILLQYPNIVSANLSLSPVWNRILPEKPKDIKIIVNYPILSVSRE